MKAINLRMILTIVISIIGFNLYAQYSVDSTNDYYYYTQKMDAYYDSIKENTSDTVKIPGYKDYERQKEFWNTRVYNCDTVEGDYSKYIQQLILYSQNPSMLPSGNNSNTWEFVGPKNLTSHNQGIIVACILTLTT